LEVEFTALHYCNEPALFSFRRSVAQPEGDPGQATLFHSVNSASSQVLFWIGEF
jgi:hypothetical protein